MFSKRQNQVAGLVQRELSEIFVHKAQEWINGKMLTVTVVRVTKDLSIANVYISVFPSKDADNTIDLLNQQVSKIRFELGNRIRHQLKRIPELRFYLDDSLDQIERIDNALKS